MKKIMLSFIFAALSPMVWAKEALPNSCQEVLQWIKSKGDQAAAATMEAEFRANVKANRAQAEKECQAVLEVMKASS